MNFNSSISIDAENLSASDGLLVLITRALDKLQPGEVLEILSDNPTVEHDLPAWARLMSTDRSSPRGVRKSMSSTLASWRSLAALSRRAKRQIGREKQAGISSMHRTGW